MHIDVITIFPDYLDPLRQSLPGKAIEAGIVRLTVHDLRRWTHDVHRAGPDRLELFFEGSAQSQMELPDNICVAPWGDLVFAEDGPGNNRLRGITPDGVAYDIANNTISEFAGPTFAPDGRTLFVNIQTTPNDSEAGYTLAIWGPFPNADSPSRLGMGNSKNRS